LPKQTKRYIKKKKKKERERKDAQLHLKKRKKKTHPKCKFHVMEIKHLGEEEAQVKLMFRSHAHLADWARCRVSLGERTAGSSQWLSGAA